MPPHATYIHFFNYPISSVVYTLSLHDALPISLASGLWAQWQPDAEGAAAPRLAVNLDRAAVVPDDPETDRQTQAGPLDRKSTRLNSSHVRTSYAVFCLKKKKT